MSTAAHVYQAINEVTAVMAKEGIAKGRTNSQQGYKFRGIDDVYCALSAHLATAKLCILPRVLERAVAEKPTKAGGLSTYAVVTVEFDLVSAVDGSKHTIRTMGEAMDTADKATNKAMSAAMKYACLMAFQIPTEGDNDADASHHEKGSRDLTTKLAASVDMVAWEKEAADALRGAAKMGDLSEAWSTFYEQGKKTGLPDAVLKRLAAVKDERKGVLSQANGHS